MAKAQDLADRVLGGELEEKLRGWRAQDPPLSFVKIAEEMERLGIPTSRETVRRWCRELGIEGDGGEE